MFNINLSINYFAYLFYSINWAVSDFSFGRIIHDIYLFVHFFIREKLKICIVLFYAIIPSRGGVVFVASRFPCFFLSGRKIGSIDIVTRI